MSKKPKTKVISARVPIEVAELFETICNKDEVTKNEVLSNLISKTYSKNVANKNLTPLEKLLTRLKTVVDKDFNKYANVETPSIILEDEERDYYFGKPQILVGNDTVIRESNGKFYIVNFHDMHGTKYLLTEDEMFDYHEGEEYAFLMNLSEHDKDCSYWKLKGYLKIMNSLNSILEEHLESQEIKNEIIKTKEFSLND